jgi:error-prone DNA polymerase
MGAKRSAERMQELKDRLYRGMAENGITGAQADQVYEQLKSFADFGFPESHAASFAHLVYASAWLKCHYPAAFYAGLLASQPMGFYSPASLIADAQRHGLTVLAPEVNASNPVASLIPLGREPHAPLLGEADLRLGLDNVKGLGEPAALRIVAAREQDGPFQSLADLARRAGIGKERMEKLAVAGALESLEPDRRKALWTAGTVDERPGTIPGTGPSAPPPTLPGMSGAELARADYTGLGLSVQIHPMELVRASLDAAGVLPAAQLPYVEDGERIEVAGIVTHRQRPSTAKGVTFLSLEDETGIANIVCSQGLWKRWQSVASVARALVIRGAVEKPLDAAPETMPMIVADKLTLLDLNGPSAPSRDFR